MSSLFAVPSSIMAEDFDPESYLDAQLNSASAAAATDQEQNGSGGGEEKEKERKSSRGDGEKRRRSKSRERKRSRSKDRRRSRSRDRGSRSSGGGGGGSQVAHYVPAGGRRYDESYRLEQDRGGDRGPAVESKNHHRLPEAESELPSTHLASNCFFAVLPGWRR